MNWTASKAVVRINSQSGMSREAIVHDVLHDRTCISACQCVNDRLVRYTKYSSASLGCAEPNQRSVLQSLLSLALVTTESLTRTTQTHCTIPIRDWYGSADHCGETALPHSSKLSSPLVEPVAYPLGLS